MSFSQRSNFIAGIIAVIAVLASSVLAAPRIETTVETSAESGASLAVISGIVRDDGGSPIADATVAIFKAGTSRVLKQVRSAADGRFITRVLPGTYTIFAVAQGFNPVTVADVEVNRNAQLSYGFRLERAGSGNTLPEKRLDRNNPKWVIRSAQNSRSIYQNTEGEVHTSEGRVTVEETTPVIETADTSRPTRTVVETYFSDGASGVNFATLLPVSDEAEFVIAGQTGIGKRARQRIEVQASFKPVEDHHFRVKGSVGTVGRVLVGDDESTLGQISIQALDEWKVREGVIFVFGADYARFIGAGNDFSFSPRLGFQYDLDAKTRFRSAFTTHTEERTWSKAIELEDAQVLFREPAAIEDILVEAGKPVMNRSSRFEFGIERVLDNSSSVAATAFFDTTLSRGIGIEAFAPGSQVSEFVGNQHGSARGLSVVYSRRINGRFSTAAGYTFGNGQKLSANGVTDPASLFEEDFFQSFFGQFEADLKTGTNVRTIFRLSPQATVFAIDPFQGRLAIYDPSLSILVTQSLPNLGLPFQAEAMVDARNLFDFHTGTAGEEGFLRLGGQGRTLRGSILVRF